MSVPPWQTLGIDHTTDDGEIRRAYTRRLKAIDVDSDPDAFIALREAFDVARVHAAHAAQAAARVPEPALADDGGPAPAESMPEADVESEAPSAEPLEAPRPTWMDDVEAIQALVYGEESREAIFAELSARAERLLNGPEMAEIDHAARVEQWAVQVILSGIPRTNALLLPAIQRFGWLARSQQWDCHPAIRAVIDRYMDCQLVNELLDGKGVFAMPFRQIYRGMPPRGSQANMVDQFLHVIRRDYPTIIQELPPESVAAWDALIERRNKRLIARWGRANAAFRVRFRRFAVRYKLDHVARWGVLVFWILVSIALVGITHGFALFFLIPTFSALFNRK